MFLFCCLLVSRAFRTRGRRIAIMSAIREVMRELEQYKLLAEEGAKAQLECAQLRDAMRDFDSCKSDLVRRCLRASAHACVRAFASGGTLRTSALCPPLAGVCA